MATLTYKEVMTSIRRVPVGHKESGYGSVLDTIQLVTGKGKIECAQTWRRLEDETGCFIFSTYKYWYISQEGSASHHNSELY